MAKSTTLELTKEQRAALEEGMKNGKTRAFRLRCQVILMKADGKTFREIGYLTNMTDISAWGWTKRFMEMGMEGLETKPGQGRKRIMDEEDEKAVRLALEQEPTSVMKAQKLWEELTGKKISYVTFNNYVRTHNMI